jgi:serine protease Do
MQPSTIWIAYMLMFSQPVLTLNGSPGGNDKTNPTRLAAQQPEEGGPICGWIGVEVGPMTRPFADSLGMTELYGAIFDQPEPNGPAAQAKIQAGDVLTTINGSFLPSSSDFIPTISAMAPGADVNLTTYRDGQLIGVKVTLGSSRCPPH